MGEKGRGHRDRGGVLGGSGEVGRDGAAFSPELAAREEETTPSFFQGLRRGGQGKRQHSLPLGTCIKRGQRGGRSLLLRTCARGARGELGGPFSGVCAVGGRGKRWVWSFSRGLRWGKPGGEIDAAFPSRPALGEAGERWVRPFFRSLCQEGPGKEIARSSPQDLRREERGENWVRPFFRSLRQEERGENWVQPFFRILRQEGPGKEMARPSPRGPPGRGSSSAELSFNGGWGRRRGWPLSTAPAWAG